MVSRAVARSRSRNDESQLELLTLTPHGYEAAQPLWAVGRSSLASGPSKNGCGTGSERTASDKAASGNRANGQGSRPDAAAVDSTGPDAATSARASLGNGAGEIHLP